MSGTGAYSFAVWNVIVSEFDLEIGDTVAPDEPYAGAGRITVPGEVDVYTFEAASGAEVFFDDLQPECEIDIIWQLEDEDGTLLFGRDEEINRCGANNRGTQRLERGGFYRLSVEARSEGRGAFKDDEDGLGPYAFQIWAIAPGEFDIGVGDTVSEDAPGPGAGVIETPGNYDVYQFDVAPGTVLRLDEIAPSCGNRFVWDLFDSDGVAVVEGDNLQVCGVDLGPVTLERGGTYSLRVRAKFDQESTGAYSFRLLEQ